MFARSAQTKRTATRDEHGGAIAEFAPAMALLFGLVVLPLLDLTIVPVRWMMAQEIVNSYARKLALCENFRQSLAMMEADPSLNTQLQKLGGISVQSIDLHLRIARVFKYAHAGEALLVSTPGTIPADWLPDGKKAPCSYSLEVDVRSLMSPAILFRHAGSSVPGLTAPIPMLITASRAWQNFGRDPANGKFYIDE
jgi:hypothetical protein